MNRVNDELLITC